MDDAFFDNIENSELPFYERIPKSIRKAKGETKMGKLLAPTQEEMMQDEREHMELARALAAECVVLLENDGVLPLERLDGRIALYGAGARNTVKGGTGSGDVNSRFVINVEDGLKEAGYDIATGDWLDRQDAKIGLAREEHRKILHRISEETGRPEFLVEFEMPFQEPAPEPVTQSDMENSRTDTAVYVLSRNSGEGADRYVKEGDYLLWKEEEESIRELAAFYPNFILVLNVGGVMDLSAVRGIPGIGAVVLMSQLGNIGGLALADLLTGKVNPSGKLADTWARGYGDYPSSADFSHNNGDTDDDDYAEGIYVGYRYFDTFGKKPLYPFGYGLSYTEFEIRPVSCAVSDGEVFVKAGVTNTGRSAGKETVQVYVSFEGAGAKLDHPYQELKGYAKTPLLAAGESCEVTVAIPLPRLASYSEKQAAWILEKGDYIVRIGNASDKTAPAAVLRVEENVTAEQCVNICPQDRAFDELRGLSGAAEGKKEGETPDGRESDAGLTVITVSAEDLPKKNVRYEKEAREELCTDRTEIITLADVKAKRVSVEELVAQLSVEELASFATGRHVRKGETSVIGNASFGVPGAAGDTSAVCLESRGIRPVSMADGPAGLRLQPHFKARHDGTILPGGNKFGDSVEPFPEYDHPEDVVDHYQYTTAIPIGWALAQSWNTELVQKAADMVGAEMEKFGVDIWLAPAMNIHRNPLCGRNFEYYSEDPVVTGLTAAAITKGVQSHKGKGVSIKHFAANNQEDNRYQTNVHVSERALREIYLRGFEICIRNAHPETIMTSYNLINGVHTADSYDLLQKAARDEWGFRGLVMTDWYSTGGAGSLSQSVTGKYPWGTPSGAVHAGNDLQMPGDVLVEDAIIRAVREEEKENGFSCTKADLQYCAANVIRSVLYADGDVNAFG